MVNSLPPSSRTDSRFERLRSLLLVAACLAGLTSPVRAKSAPVKVLLSAPVSEAALSSMSSALWSKLLATYINADVVPFAGAPTLADCHKAAAEFMASAPFDLRLRLPGMANSTGRVAAQTHLVVTNCITDAVVVDQTIPFDSDPPSNANQGDFESVPEISWAKSVPAALGKFPGVSFFPRVAHITQVTPPLALVDIRGENLRVGEALRVFAGRDKALKKPPIVLTVTQVFPKYVEVMFSTLPGAEIPRVGDLVEPSPAQ